MIKKWLLFLNLIALSTNTMAVPLNQIGDVTVSYVTQSQEHLKMKYMVLLQPQEVVQTRVNSPTDIANYVKQLDKIVAPVFRQIDNNQGFVVVAINHMGKTKVWYDFKRLPSEQVLQTLTHTIQQLKPFAVKENFVGFAVAYETGNETMTKQFPMPVEWQQDLQKPENQVDFDSFILKTW